MVGLELKTANLEALYSSMRQNVDDASAELQKLYKDIDDTKVDLALCEADRDSLVAEIESLALQRDEIRKTLYTDELTHQGKLDSIKDDGEAYLASLRAQSIEAQNKLVDLNQAIATADGAFQSVTADIKLAQEQLAALDTQKEALLADISLIIDKGKKLVDAIDLSNERVATLDAAIKERIAELDAIEADIAIKREETKPIKANFELREAAIATKERDFETMRARFNAYSMENFGFPTTL